MKQITTNYQKVFQTPRPLILHTHGYIFINISKMALKRKKGAQEGDARKTEAQSLVF